MFAIGVSKSKVHYSKLALPKEYNLGKKDRTIYGVWVDNKKLYLSDEIDPLKSKASKTKQIFKVKVNAGAQIKVPTYLDKAEATITGCISTIRIEFTID